MVSEQTCKISYKIDTRLRQKISKTNLIHSSYKKLPSKRSRGNCSTALSIGSIFQDSDFAGDLEDSKSTSAGVLCIFGRRTFVPVSWMCEKQPSVSRGSTKSEIISLDAGLLVDGCRRRTIHRLSAPPGEYTPKISLQHAEKISTLRVMENSQYPMSRTSSLHGQSAENVQLQVLYQR